MTASRPPSAPKKRPWYLMAALVASWLYGAHILGTGYEELAFIHGDRPDLHEVTDPIAGVEARQAAYEAGERWVAAKEGAKSRELPIGAASLLLGAAMVVFAARSVARREGSRSALVQVLLVHFGVLVAAFVTTRNVMGAEVAYEMRVQDGMTGGVPHGFNNDPAVVAEAAALRPVIERAIVPVALLLNTALSGLVILALTRPRARAFFHEAEAGPLGEG